MRFRDLGELSWSGLGVGFSGLGTWVHKVFLLRKVLKGVLWFMDLGISGSGLRVSYVESPVAT